jgi:hypothetical protein
MNRITCSVILLLALVGLGSGCSKPAAPAPGPAAPLPTRGPESLHRSILPEPAPLPAGAEMPGGKPAWPANGPGAPY